MRTTKNIKIGLSSLLREPYFTVQLNAGERIKLSIDDMETDITIKLRSDGDSAPLGGIKYRIEFVDGTPPIHGITGNDGLIHHEVSTACQYAFFIEDLSDYRPTRISSRPAPKIGFE